MNLAFLRPDPGFGFEQLNADLRVNPKDAIDLAARSAAKAVLALRSRDALVRQDFERELSGLLATDCMSDLISLRTDLSVQLPQARAETAGMRNIISEITREAHAAIHPLKSADQISASKRLRDYEQSSLEYVQIGDEFCDFIVGLISTLDVAIRRHASAMKDDPDAIFSSIEERYPTIMAYLSR